MSTESEMNSEAVRPRTYTKCVSCHAEKPNFSSRCQSCADKHRIKNREAYYIKKYGKLPENDVTRGNRPTLRDQLLKLLSDGQPRTSKQVREELNWAASTSIAKTLSDISDFLRDSGSSRQLVKTPLGLSKRSGVQWQLRTKDN
jgi:hypothetical protein